MNIHKLLDQLSGQEEALRRARFLAPRVAGGKVRVRIDGLVVSLTPRPADFEGWGVFRAVDSRRAQLEMRADAAAVEFYLSRLRSGRVRLCSRLRGSTWSAYPVNESVAARHLGGARPLAVQLVEGGEPFEQLRIRWDGSTCWYESLDRSADPRVAERMRRLLREGAPADTLAWPGMTPEEQTVYRLASGSMEFDRQLRDRKVPQSLGERSVHHRLESALAMGGGQLQDYRDQGHAWSVDWRSTDGRLHSSIIAKNDLTVISAGLCLDDGDSEFDLQSLVGVVENAEPWAF